MRGLGLGVTSAGSIRAVKREAERLRLDTTHFTGQRRWSDAQLIQACHRAGSWPELLSELGLLGDRGARVRIRAHAIRLGLDLSRLADPSAGLAPDMPRPALGRLRDAGSTIAGSWFQLCGFTVSFPVEPAVFDLLVAMPGGIRQVQVKTTTHNGKDGWLVSVGHRPYSAGNKAALVPYDPEVIDYFFIIDGALNLYLIPSRVVAGRVGILLRNYTRFIVGSAESLLRSAA